MSIKLAFSFDGCGINDATDPYRPRIATLTRRADVAAQDYGWGAFKVHGELMAQAPAMLAALRECVKSLEYAAMVLDPPAVSTFRESITTARALLAPFERVET